MQSELAAHPDFEEMSREDLAAHKKDLEDKIGFGSKNGADRAIIVWLLQERRMAEAELVRRNGNAKPGLQQDFWPDSLHLEDFLTKTVAGETWIWEDALPINATSMIAGQPRTGKSTLALNLALAISRGARFLGRDTIQYPALYVSIDNSDAEFRTMVDRLHGVKTDKLWIHTGKVPDKRVEWLTDQCSRHGTKFIVIDTFQRFFDIRNINDSAECVDAMSPLDLRIKEMGIHLMYLHHAGKGDPRTGDPTQTAALGSISIKGMTPWYFQFSRIGTGQRILSSDFRGGKNFDQAYIEQDHKSGWCILGGTLEDAFITDAVPKVMDYIDDEGQVTEGQICAAVEARAIIVSKAIRRLFSNDQISRTGSGKRGDPFKYSRSNTIPGTPGTESQNIRQLRDYIK
jgi:hypothetical protein